MNRFLYCCQCRRRILPQLLLDSKHNILHLHWHSLTSHIHRQILPFVSVSLVWIYKKYFLCNYSFLLPLCSSYFFNESNQDDGKRVKPPSLCRWHTLSQQNIRHTQSGNIFVSWNESNPNHRFTNHALCCMRALTLLAQPQRNSNTQVLLTQKHAEAWQAFCCVCPMRIYLLIHSFKKGTTMLMLLQNYTDAILKY